jgi:hypothetical protein
VSPDVEVGPQRDARDAELAGRGWLRRFTGSPPRLTEVTELYETLGLEVLLDPLTAEELPDTCAGCTAAMSLFRVVYTRPRPDKGQQREGIN